MGLFAQPGPWYYLDPDNRVDEPEHTAMFCCRCHKTLQGVGGTVVEVSRDGWWVRNNPLGKSLMGRDCMKITFKDDNLVNPTPTENGK